MYNHPKLTRGKVWCKTCSREANVDPTSCFKYGWPKCCGYTMTIDSPSERCVLPLVTNKEYDDN